MIGRAFNSYRITRKLGEGSTGEVYAAEHLTQGKSAAIKILRPELSAHRSVVARFLAEARPTARVPHPGLIDVFDFGQAPDGTLFLVMELLEGEGLDRLIQRARPLPLPLLTGLARQLCDALGAAHAGGLVHRDLTPSSIFTLPDAAGPGGLRIKVLDFGIAPVALPPPGVKTRAPLIVGTAAYMSPEQCRDPASANQRADIYSLGCILFEMACGRVPFLMPEMADVLKAQLEKATPPPSAYNPEVTGPLDAIVIKALAKDPAERFQSMGELDLALSSLQTPATVGAIPVGELRKALVPIRRRYTANMQAVPDGAAPKNEATRVVRMPARPPSFEAAFLAAHEALARVTAGAGAGVAVAVVEGAGTVIDSRFLAVNKGLVVGRHSECAVKLTAPETALRQLAVLSTSENGKATVRVWDLNSQVPFRTEDGAPSAAVVCDGPLFLTTGPYGLIFLPRAEGSPALAKAADQAFAALPARNFLDHRQHERGPEMRVASVGRSPVTGRTNVTHVPPVAVLNPAEEVASAWGEITLRTMERKQKVKVSAEQLGKGILLGRYERCGVLLSEHESISRVHLLLVRVGDRLVAIDTASTAGTERREAPVSAAWLADQDSLVLGGQVRMDWKRLPVA